MRVAVAAREPVDTREAAALARTLEELDRLEDPFSREAAPVHVTGSAVVTGPRGVLLLRHRLLGFWVQPGGHLEPGETPWEAARREAQEETGLAVEPVGPPAALLHVDVHGAAHGHTHLDLRYRFEVEGDPTPRPPAGESQEVAWYDWDSARSTADPGLAGLLQAMRG